jgi:hypothetical protein
LKKTFVETKLLDVRGKKWYSIKVKLDTEFQVHKEKKGSRKKWLNSGFSKDQEQPPRTKSWLGETGDCDGTFEFGMGSGVCIEKERAEE